MVNKVKINNYFYQFEIQKEGMNVDEVLEKIFNNITLKENKVSKDYDKIKIHNGILSISEIEKEGQYRVVLLKGPYGYKLNFIEKDIDLSKISGEKEVYGVDSGKRYNQMEEIHYYCSLKIGISDNGEFIKGIISIPRIRDGINSEEVGDILKLLFEKIIGVGYFRDLRSAYSEGKILSIFSNATEINFIKDVYIDDFIGSQQIQQEGRPRGTIKVKVSGHYEVGKWKNEFSSNFGKKSEHEIKQELTPLRNFRVKTKTGTFAFEGDEFKLCNSIEVSEYINILQLSDREYFTRSNLDFINQKFKNYFKK